MVENDFFKVLDRTGRLEMGQQFFKRCLSSDDFFKRSIHIHCTYMHACIHSIHIYIVLTYIVYIYIVLTCMHRLLTCMLTQTYIVCIYIVLTCMHRLLTCMLKQTYTVYIYIVLTCMLTKLHSIHIYCTYMHKCTHTHTHTHTHTSHNHTHK